MFSPGPGRCYEPGATQASTWLTKRAARRLLRLDPPGLWYRSHVSRPFSAAAQSSVAEPAREQLHRGACHRHCLSWSPIALLLCLPAQLAEQYGQTVAKTAPCSPRTHSGTVCRRPLWVRGEHGAVFATV